MKLGMATLIELDGIDEQIALCQELELEFIELNLNLPEYSPSVLDAEWLKRKTTDTGIAFTIHMPENLDYGCFQEEVREGVLRYFRRVVDWAARAGVKIITLHLNNGVHFKLPHEKVFITEEYIGIYLKNIMDTMTHIADEAFFHGIKIHIENTGNFHLGYIQVILENLMQIRNVFLTWDVGHDVKSGLKDYEVIKMYQSKVAHMHLHDYNGISDHQVPYTGVSDIDRYLKYADSNDLWVVVEVKSVEGLKSSMIQLEQRSHTSV